MNSGSKRKDMQKDDDKPKRVKRECDYGERCYRRNPAHFREFTHQHLEAILNTYSGAGPYSIPDKYSMDQLTITEQLDVIVEKQIYTPWVRGDNSTAQLSCGNDGDRSSSATQQPPKPQEKTKNSSNSHPTTSSSSTSSSSTTSSTPSSSLPYDQRKPLKGILKNSPQRAQQNLKYQTPNDAQKNVSPIPDTQNSTPEGVQKDSPTHKGVQKNMTTNSHKQTLQGDVKITLIPQKDQSTPPKSHNIPQGSQGVPLYPLFKKTTKPGVQNNPLTSQSSLIPQEAVSDAQTIQGSLNRAQASPGVRKTPQEAQNTSQESQKASRGVQKSPHEAQKTPQQPQKTSPGANKTATGEGQRNSNTVDGQNSSKAQSSDYRPIVPPTRRVEDYLNVVVPKGKMAAKHDASAPYYIFYTTITAARETHNQPYSITFQEILDHSLGELKCSLQINFMVELGWLLAQYYFAGCSEKRLTILYGEESPDLQTINQKKPHVDAHMVRMSTPFGKHHTKMMVLCYEDGSLRVVVSTANLYIDDWENRTQGLWFSPRCPELPPTAMPHDGDSPTMFKRTLLRYLNNYQLPALTTYIERVKRCDFSHINVFLVASVPGSHFDVDWGMTRVGALFRQHCAIPAAETKQWPLLAQASSIGSYGKEPSLWLTGDFLHHFTKIKDQPQTLSSPAALKVIYPSLENVQNSHDRLLGGGCLPYAASAHLKQPWLNDFLYQWRATNTKRDRAMPHIKSYTRVSPDNKRAAYFLLTSGNISKAAWGSINKGNAALRIMSYEAGVLFIPRFIINEDFFPLEEKQKNRLVLPFDVPPVKYTVDMSPWVSDYLMG